MAQCQRTLWFVIALLIFSTGLAVWRYLRPMAPVGTESVPARGPTVGVLLGFAGLLGFGTFLVRLVQPIGTNILNLQLCFFLQYIAFFAAGIHAARHGWLGALAGSPAARRAGWLAFLLGPPALLALIIVFGARDGLGVYLGGWHWPALGEAAWEQFAGLGFSLGLLALFSQRLNRDHPAWRWLSDRSFGVYLLHAPVLVALMMLYRPLPQNPYFLSALLTVSGLGVSFMLADLARRIPGLRAIV